MTRRVRTSSLEHNGRAVEAQRVGHRAVVVAEVLGLDRVDGEHRAAAAQLVLGVHSEAARAGFIIIHCIIDARTAGHQRQSAHE